MDANDLYTLLIQLLMAACGAVARQLNHNSKGKIRMWSLMSDVFVAGFTALILYWLTYSEYVNRGYMFAASGMAGWIGPKLLNRVIGSIARKSGIDLKGTENEISES